MGKESRFQAKLVGKIKERLPGCVVLRNDPTRNQGIPDLLVLHGDRWAMLEVKQSATADVQPNQEYYVEEMNSRAYASFVYPENEEEVLHALQRALGSQG